MRPFRIIIMEGNPLYSESTDLNINAKQKNICTEASRIMFGQISACRGLAKLTHKSNHLTHTRVCSLNLPRLPVAQELLLISSFPALLLSLSRLHVSTLWLLSRPFPQPFCLFCSTLTPHLHYHHLLIFTSSPTTPNNSPLQACTLNFTPFIACNACLP